MNFESAISKSRSFEQKFMFIIFSSYYLLLSVSAHSIVYAIHYNVIGVIFIS